MSASTQQLFGNIMGGLVNDCEPRRCTILALHHCPLQDNAEPFAFLVLRGSHPSFIKDTDLSRETWININRSTEQFPEEIKHGYRIKDLDWSKRPGLWIKRIEVQGISYRIRPSFVAPYLTGWVNDTDKALFLRKFSVPFRALASVFRKTPMHRHRLEQAIGRESIVGTTIRQAGDLPEHVVADDKHSRIRGDMRHT